MIERRVNGKRGASVDPLPFTFYPIHKGTLAL